MAININLTPQQLLEIDLTMMDTGTPNVWDDTLIWDDSEVWNDTTND